MSNTIKPPLKKGTIRCPKCKEDLHFECIGSIRVIRDGLLHSRCPKCKRSHTVQPNEKL